MSCQTLPLLWLLSDARNDAVLERALADLPKGSGFVFRHHHLPDEAWVKRLKELLKLAETKGFWTLVPARRVICAQMHLDGAQGGLAGIYGSPDTPETDQLPLFATVHDEAEILAANAVGAKAVFLSPVFPTRSHPGALSLGPERFRELAAKADMPVIALGGMTAAKAGEIGWPRWAAIGGLSPIT